jgi:hypothetical protein
MNHDKESYFTFLLLCLFVFLAAASCQANAATKKYPAPVARTGQTTSIAPGDDGSLQSGVQSPIPRFVDDGDTVLDRLTGLIWMKDVGALTGLHWIDALTACNSSVGWRLPNIREFLSLVDFEQSYPALPLGHPFVNVPSPAMFWTSTSNAVFDTQPSGIRHDHYGVDIDTVEIRFQGLDGSNAWCVRSAD